MRLFLDAHISARRIAARLREAGHDMRAADEERELDGLGDERLLTLATGEGRAMITFDVKDFTVIAQRWAEASRPHAGLGIVLGIDHGEFGAIVDALTGALAMRPDQAAWADLTLFVGRGQ